MQYQWREATTELIRLFLLFNNRVALSALHGGLL